MAVAVATKLEFGVGDDDTSLGGDRPPAVIDEETEPAELHRFVRADHRCHALEGDILVMAHFGLGRRAEDRHAKPAALLESGWERLTSQGGLRAILLPRRTGEVAAHDALDGEDLGAPAEHSAAGDRGAMGRKRRNGGDDLVDVRAQHVMPNDAGKLTQPPGGELGEDRPLVGNALPHHDIESAHAVTGDE